MSHTTRARAGLLAALATLTLTAGCAGPLAPAAEPVPSATLEKALLTVADLPAGYRANPATSAAPTPSGSLPASDASDACAGFRGDTSPFALPETASASFSQKRTGGNSETGEVTHQLMSGPADDVEGALDRLRETLEKCRSFSLSEGQFAATMTIAEETAPDLGDQAVAFRMTLSMPMLTGGTQEDATYWSRAVVVRVGNVATTVTAGGGSEGTELADELARKAVAKVEAL
ncbi:MAG TPA: hypothetical protein VGP02_13215 [Mycobacteriales bacterium]|jgi:hypothetical protein|nr:hypothetical protein [Mycobacteriales bacterium]